MLHVFVLCECILMLVNKVFAWWVDIKNLTHTCQVGYSIQQIFKYFFDSIVTVFVWIQTAGSKLCNCSICEIYYDSVIAKLWLVLFSVIYSISDISLCSTLLFSVFSIFLPTGISMTILMSLGFVRACSITMSVSVLLLLELIWTCCAFRSFNRTGSPFSSKCWLFHQMDWFSQSFSG